MFNIRIVPVLVAIILATACGGGSSAPQTPTSPNTPTAPQQNRAPVINSINVTPSFGVSELTSFVFSASASDADGDPVSYSWDLASNPRSGSSGSITFVGSGAANMSLTVTDGKGGSVTDSRTVTVGNATGSWRGTGTNLGAFTMSLTQNGARVTGGYNDSTFGPGQIDPAQPGAINASGHLEMRLKQGRFTDFTFRGDMDQSGRRIVGQIFGYGFNGQSFTMDKQ